MSQRQLRVAALLTVALALGACVHVSPPAPLDASRLAGPLTAIPRLHPGARRLLLVMIDGLPVRLFEESRAGGEVPRLAALLAARPTLEATALSTLPSSTAPSLPELLSGAYADTSDPTEPGAVHAFDREERRVVRYFTQPGAWQWPVPDLFTAAATAGLPAMTVAEGRWDGAQTVLTRGPVLRDAALEVLGIESFNGDREPVERLVARFGEPAPPAVVLLVFNSVDLAGHLHGPDSPETHRALAQTDALLGRLLDQLAARRGADGRPLLEDTTLILFGDHGMVPSGSYLNLQPFFQHQGLSTFDASSVSQVAFRERLGTLWTRWPDVLLVAGGSNVTQVYLRSPSGAWEPGATTSPGETQRGERAPSAADLAPQLAELAGVSQVLRALDDGRVEIRARGDRVAYVERQGKPPRESFAYVLAQGSPGDPLEYLDDPEVAPAVCREEQVRASCFRSRLEWQRLTAGARFPGVVPLLPKALSPPRFTGDLVVTALPGYSFLKGQKGDHGNLEREAMTTPLIFNGPGIDPEASLGLARLVDIYPTAVVLLGADPADPALDQLDGRPLPGCHGPEPGPSAEPDSTDR